MTERMKPVTLPWPPKEVSPNYRERWHGEKRKPYAEYRDTCSWIIRAHCMGLPMSWGKAHPEGPVTVEVLFIEPDRRGRDLDNMFASIKGALDALAQETGINDKRFAFEIDREYEKGRREVQIGMRFD